MHAVIYRLSRGRLLGRVGGHPVLLLKTFGRRSGRHRVTPVQYMPHGDAFVIVASNAGARLAPAWYLNLKAHPRAGAMIAGRHVELTAREATGSQRSTLWQTLTDADSNLETAATKSGRRLPVIVLTPTET
jgi:deazaflavin-dependent oxidoreductase (nitroreductase family)